MPTYEYACEKCGAHFDVVHGFNERGPRKCRECGGGPLRKVFHPAGIVLKGSGFYKTDSRSSSPDSAAASGSKKSDSGKPDPGRSDSGSKSQGTSSDSSGSGSGSGSGGPSSKSSSASSKD